MFLVVFRSRPRPDRDETAYAADAAIMLELASRQPGFLGFKSYAAVDGETVSISEWASAADAKAWGRHPEHRAVQARGMAEYYASYTSWTCENPGERQFERNSL